MTETLDQLIKAIQVVDESNGEALTKLGVAVQLQAFIDGREEQVIDKLIKSASLSQDASMNRKIGMILMGFSSPKALNASRSLLFKKDKKWWQFWK